MGIYRLSLKNIKRRKLRSFLTMLGIIIGVATLVLLMGAGTGMKAYTKDQVQSMAGDIVIYNSSGGMYASGEYYLDSGTVSKIKNLSQVYNVREETQFNSNIKNSPVVVVGLSDWSEIKVNGTTGVVIDKAMADKFGYKIGSKITIKDQEFTITGTTKQMSMGMGLVFLDIDKALPLNNNKVSSVSASTKGDPESVKKDVESQVPGTMALTQSDFTQQIDDMMNGIMLFIGAIASIGLIVGVISIVNIMMVNVTERTREIGVLKAIGFTNGEVLSSILAEAGLLGFIGSLIGLILAAALLQLAIIFLGPQLGMEDITLLYMLPPWLIVAVIGGATILSMLAGLYPAWKASRLNVVEALRHE
jgi:putative ABC transport system permease protein